MPLAIHVVVSEFYTRPPRSPVRRPFCVNIAHSSQWHGMLHLSKAAILLASLNIIGFWATSQINVTMEVTKASSMPHGHEAGLLSSYVPLSGACSIRPPTVLILQTVPSWLALGKLAVTLPTSHQQTSQDGLLRITKILIG
jgi:hypothetical protein